MRISERIFKIMDEQGISQIEFSRETGISQSTISDWKHKGTNPASDKILTICNYLKVSPYEILQDTKPKNNADYVVVGEGSQAYDILMEIEKLDTRQIERLKGYLTAIKE